MRMARLDRAKRVRSVSNDEDMRIWRCLLHPRVVPLAIILFFLVGLRPFVLVRIFQRQPFLDSVY